VPWADFNLLKLPAGTEHENDFAMLSDVFPTGYHGTELARVRPGDTEAIIDATDGAGVDCGVEAVGYQAHDQAGQEHPEMVLDKLVEAVRATGRIGVVGVYNPQDPGAATRVPRRAGTGCRWTRPPTRTPGLTAVRTAGPRSCCIPRPDAGTG
jgi:glutathione-independent formaldehyde dehydrogenase